MSSGNKGSWDLPTYSKSGVLNFSNPYGTSYFSQGTGGANSGTFGVNLTPSTQEYSDQLSAMRNSILSGLGYTAPSREASLNQWQDTFSKEALRTAQPQLEQSLFARGLGGSKYYSDSLTDLLSKVNTQAVLNRENLANTDEQLKLSQLSSVNSGMSDLINQINSLSGSAYGATSNQWNTLLPYLAEYNQEPGTYDLLGQGIGGLGALALAPFTGGASLAALPAAMSAGGSIGSMFNEGGNSGIDLSSLASLFTGGLGNYANIAGMGKVKVAPANYYNSAAASRWL
jgi:hypothetical protein